MACSSCNFGESGLVGIGDVFIRLSDVWVAVSGLVFSNLSLDVLLIGESRVQQGVLECPMCLSSWFL